MALILKPRKTYTDPHGNVYKEAYAVVDDCNGNKKRKSQHFVLEIYKDKDAREKGLQPVKGYPYDVSGEEFEKWFSVEAIDENDNQYKQSYLYLLQLEDEEGLIWEDWQSDE